MVTAEECLIGKASQEDESMRHENNEDREYDARLIEPCVNRPMMDTSCSL